MADLWMPAAERHDIRDHAPTDGGPAKAVAHITWDRNATEAKPQALVPYDRLRTYFTGAGKGVAPHVLWNPFDGKLCQFVPATSRSKSLADGPGGTRTNRAGSVVLQIEALFFPWCVVDGKAYESLDDTPCEGWDALHAWVSSWGVPDVWPLGRPTDFRAHRDEEVWRSAAGWYAHAQVPENTHQDPGSWPRFPRAGGGGGGGAQGGAGRTYEPFPGSAWFTLGRRSPVVARMHRRLVAVGCDRYRSSSGKDTLGSGDVASYEAWQRKYSADHGKGWTGSALTWPPGKETWDALKVPRG
ncbi:peptidoglycan-binding protein [Streptomyces liangshanensis]|uniref:peptidoglycan-binding protein n=1 Tax=Streptomyces liangshanensis TaxID=2717324 RepID=UPI001AAE5DAA|nr:peptidoglycan-binding protein [Streptomyces liangshanensis]